MAGTGSAGMVGGISREGPPAKSTHPKTLEEGMKRKTFIQNSIGFGLSLSPVFRLFNSPLHGHDQKDWRIKGPARPYFIYNNWSAYDELSDRVAQTEELAMRELNELVRLKRLGVQVDYYVMDAFWFSREGGYRTWLKTHWPEGPDRWLSACKENQIKPGMWFSTNLVRMGGKQALDIIPEWEDSLGTDPNILCLFAGGYLAHLAETLQFWYDRGVRLFKFDFAYFEAVTPSVANRYSKAEVEEKNKLAFMGMLQHFRAKNKDVLITGYNGFGGEMENTAAEFKKTIDRRWLDCFDTLYSGDPRFSDLPMMNIWRSADNYSDHMNRQFEFNGLPLHRIDSCAFMIGKTGTCYYRGTQAWKGMAILEFARGGWVNVVHGNLELWSDADARWLARLQGLYLPLQQKNQISSFGGIPGKGVGYGFRAIGDAGELFALVNGSQQTLQIKLPSSYDRGGILYADGGFNPRLEKRPDGLYAELGAEQLVLAGTGSYHADEYKLGKDESIRIPLRIDKLESVFRPTEKNRIMGEARVSKDKLLRIIFQQFDRNGYAYRSWGGAPPDGKKMNDLLKIEVTQNGRPVKTKINYDKMIWSGLSWAVAEVEPGEYDQSRPLGIGCSSMEKEELTLQARLYELVYGTEPG